MSIERSRRERFEPNTLPLFEWLIFGLAVAVVAVSAFATPLNVQAVVLALGGHGFTWPENLLAAWGGIVHGDFGRGLPKAAAGAVPGFSTMTALAGIAEAVVLASLWVLGSWLAEATGRTRRYGIASRAQASEALGLVRLRRVAKVIRPDLYGSSGTRRRGKRAEREGFDPHHAGWRLGSTPGAFGEELWVPADRTTAAIGAQGSGKTLDILVPALLDWDGAAVVTLTKPEDLFLSLEARAHDGRPVAVLDPFNLAPSAPQFVWDLLEGCENPMIAQRRAKAFAAGTIKGGAMSSGDQAARFYAGECAKVLQALFHAAAISRFNRDGTLKADGGYTLDDVMDWAANPRQNPTPDEVLRAHPLAAKRWDALYRSAIFGDERTAGNTITTVHQALELFFQEETRLRCIPSAEHPGTDIEALIRAGGTIYLLGREDPYSSASPMMTAVTEQILDTAKRMGELSPIGRLCPPFLACLDELPSTAPIPTLATRMANERALGLTFMLAFQTREQVNVCYGEAEARTILGLCNNLVLFGGGKDIKFYEEMSELVGNLTHTKTRLQSRGGARIGGVDPSWDPERVRVLEAAELRKLKPGRALVLAEMYDPIIARLHRCIEGPRGKELLAAQKRARASARARVDATASGTPEEGQAPNLAATMRRLGLSDPGTPTPPTAPRRACGECGEPWPDNATVCPECGAAEPAALVLTETRR